MVGQALCDRTWYAFPFPFPFLLFYSTGDQTQGLTHARQGDKCSTIELHLQLNILKFSYM
jgi:hypothetical protein